MKRILFSCVLLVMSGVAVRPAAAQEPAPAAWEAVSTLIRRELDTKRIPALSIAVIDDQRVIWSQGFGYSNPASFAPATPQTMYRVGSVSKLFTDLAIMQLVEQKKVDLDAPVSKYLPDFHPQNPFDTPITIRSLMAHRSGLVRESPVGSYFDATGPTLAATVESLNRTRLVYKPGTHTKYSNAGVSVLGRVVEVLTGQPFARYVQHNLLDPIGMKRSSFEQSPAVKYDLAKGYLWSYDGRQWEAPVFDLGIAPAGNLYSSMAELAEFTKVLLRGGSPVVQTETLRRMWEPAYPDSGYGLGFGLRQWEGKRAVGHNGAVFGYATAVMVLPDEKLAVVAAATKDSANPVVGRVAEFALTAALAARAGETVTVPAATQSVPAEMAKSLAGRYAAGSETLELSWQQGALYATRFPSGQRVAMRLQGNDLVMDDVLAYGERWQRIPDGLKRGDTVWKRMADSAPAAMKPEWRGLIGEYGRDEDVLYVLEKDGKLYTLIEWYDYYPLEAVSADRFRFPSRGLYDGEELTFERDAKGQVIAARVDGVKFARRPVGTSDSPVFRVQPLRPVAELRAEALKAAPPKEAGDLRKSELVDLTTLDPAIKLDVRYASADNFLSTPVYTSSRAFLQRPAATALARAQQKLKERGLGLLIHDAYRPWYVTKIFWDATRADQHDFVADPSKGSRHNRGCAVDLTLYDLKSGQPVEMVSLYDEMSPRAFPDYPGGTALGRYHRQLLRQAMEAEGFNVYEFEWWHFDYQDWPWYGIQNIRFEEVGK